MNPVKIGLAVQGGLSTVCATCKKYWAARDRNIPGDTCLAKRGCAGPVGGGDYAEYDGPISDLSRWCFRCGADSKYGVQVTGRQRIIGVCEEHVRSLADLKPMGQPGIHPKYAIRSNNGALTVREILGPEKKSLFQAINDVERTFDKDDK